MHKVFVYMTFVTGLFLVALGCVFMLKASEWGLQPWNMLNLALANTTGLTVGTWNQITSAILLIMGAIISKQFPKLGAIAIALLIGVFINLIMHYDRIPAANNSIVSLVYFLYAIVLIAIGSGMYMACKLGASPKSSFILALCSKFNWSYGYVNIVVDGFAVVLAIILNEPLTLGTFIFWITIGPLTQWFMNESERIISDVSILLRNPRPAWKKF